MQYTYRSYSAHYTLKKIYLWILIQNRQIKFLCVINVQTWQRGYINKEWSKCAHGAPLISLQNSYCESSYYIKFLHILILPINLLYQKIQITIWSSKFCEHNEWEKKLVNPDITKNPQNPVGKLIWILVLQGSHWIWLSKKLLEPI